MFALFDAGLDDQTKAEMARKLNNTRRPRTFPLGKPAFPDLILTNTPNVTLDCFVGPRSWLLFERLGSNGTWLALPPNQWEHDADFMRMYDVVRQLSVVNDAAERAIKDITEYANVAKDGCYREDIMIVSNSHRVKLPGFSKNEMKENM